MRSKKTSLIFTFGNFSCASMNLTSFIEPHDQFENEFCVLLNHSGLHGSIETKISFPKNPKLCFFHNFWKHLVFSPKVPRKVFLSIQHQNMFYLNLCQDIIMSKIFQNHDSWSLEFSFSRGKWVQYFMIQLPTPVHFWHNWAQYHF